MTETVDITGCEAPRNAVTGTLYGGKNVEALIVAQAVGGYATSEWLTYRQALSIGRCVRKGEKAAARISKLVTKTVRSGGKDRKVNVMRGYAVFNVAQTDVLAMDGVAEAS